MNEKMINVLFVDDEEHNLISFRASFRKAFNIFTSNSASEAEVVLSKNVIHVLITDQKMPIKTGTELLAETFKKYPDQSRILLTAYGDKAVLIDAINKGHIFMYIEKPWNDVVLERCIKDAYNDYYKRKHHIMRAAKLTKENRNLKRTIRKRK